MAKIYENILETIGDTPVVKINSMGPKHVDLYVKLEAFNPLGSVKDRLALGIIETAEKDGSLQPGQTVVEGSSGNTGIGLAMVCAQKGYPLVITMAENFSVERRKLMRFLGARVVLTPAAEKGSGMVAKARELAEEHGWYYPAQFENEANPDMHSRTTAREIINDFSEIGLDYWVSGFGTGGTLKGVARVLKAESPNTIIVAVEPDNSPLLSTGIAQPYLKNSAPAASHPSFRPHLMQGWSPDFIPKLANDVLEDKLVDRIMPSSGLAALRVARELAMKEGIFCGITSGAAFATALEIAETAPAGSSILCMLPDTGERYLSTALFDEVSSEMSPEEMDISRSTANCRFDVKAPPAKPEKESVQVEVAKSSAIEFVETAIANPDQPVIMFSLEWCEFCWSVRKMFDEVGIAYRSIDLDSVEYQKNNLGGDIRTALKEKTAQVTIPQIFVGGEHIGGCTETFDAFNDGDLQEMLVDNAVKFNSEKKPDAYGFLPTWLHPR